MSKEFGIRMAQNAAENLQKRTHCKEDINKIFEQILLDNSVLRRYVADQGLNFNEFMSMIREYQQALIQEVDFLPDNYLTLKSNHPLRAAVALSNLNAPQSPSSFLLNLEAFTKEANNSHFYPRTKAIAAAIVIGLLFATVTALVVFSLFPVTVTSRLFLSLSAFVGIITGSDTLDANNAHFRPIFAAKEAGNRVGGFFSNPKKHPVSAPQEKSGLASSVSAGSVLILEQPHGADGESPPNYELRADDSQRPPQYAPPSIPTMTMS